MTQTAELPIQELPLEVQKDNPVNLITLAIEKGASLETIDKLMTLEERWRANKARAEFAKDFVEMKDKLPRVIRTKANTQTKSNYAPLEDVNHEVDPILSQYGFGTSTKIIAQTPDSITIEAELWHKAGHIERTSILMPLDDKGMQGTVNKTKPHAVSSSVTYGKRVAICALLNISTGDDKDGNGEKEISELVRKSIAEIKTSEALISYAENQKHLHKMPEFRKMVQDKLTQLKAPKDAK